LLFLWGLLESYFLLKALNYMHVLYAPVSCRKDCSMSALVTLTWRCSSLPYLAMVVLQTMVANVMTLVKALLAP
jgi:hypothetical protein